VKIVDATKLQMPQRCAIVAYGWSTRMPAGQEMKVFFLERKEEDKSFGHNTNWCNWKLGPENHFPL